MPRSFVVFWLVMVVNLQQVMYMLFTLPPNLMPAPRLPVSPFMVILVAVKVVALSTSIPAQDAAVKEPNVVLTTSESVA